MSSPEENQFVKDAYAEIPEMEIASLEANEQVKKLITSQDSQIGTINYGGIDIKFKLFLPKSLRHKMQKIRIELGNASGSDVLAITEKSMYELLGSICVEPPWNDWKSWAYVDEKLKDTGGVQFILTLVMSQVSQAADNTKNFRRK